MTTVLVTAAMSDNSTTSISPWCRMHSVLTLVFRHSLAHSLSHPLIHSLSRHQIRAAAWAAVHLQHNQRTLHEKKHNKPKKETANSKLRKTETASTTTPTMTVASKQATPPRQPREVPHSNEQGNGQTTTTQHSDIWRGVLQILPPPPNNGAHNRDGRQRRSTRPRDTNKRVDLCMGRHTLECDQPTNQPTNQPQRLAA